MNAVDLDPCGYVQDLALLAPLHVIGCFWESNHIGGSSKLFVSTTLRGCFTASCSLDSRHLPLDDETVEGMAQK